jgi:hypothetical protein
MGAARFGHRTPGTVPGLPHPPSSRAPRGGANDETQAPTWRRHPSFDPSLIANLEMIARARRAGLAQAMEDMLSEPHRPDPRDASVEEPQRLYRLRGPFFAALWELQIVEHIADLAQPPKDWRRQEFIDAVQRLIWVATVRVSVRHRARTKLDAKGMRNALAAVLRARDALQQLDGLVDTAPLEPLIADLSLWLGANPERGAAAKRGRRRGSESDWVFKWFVRQLLSSARTFDAKLTLSQRAGEARGTLSKVLVLLRPHLACIPRVLPYKTLERLHAEHSRRERNSPPPH